ncbi:MAG TPA: ZIP family metal transporter [Rudaea sp.]|jgi:ZIP family zinc transporter|nr:ZIP family metal transporter [Rudaea sp.]
MGSINIFIIAAALAAAGATFAGGYFAFWLRHRSHFVYAFSAGAIIAVAFFDLLPEAMSLGLRLPPRQILAVASGGFFLYMLMDRALAASAKDRESGFAAPVQRRGWIGALSFCIHSAMDGLALGWSFHASSELGVAVAFAILAHDFSDGINTVGVLLRHGNSPRQALYWLTTDALAPILGAGLSLLIAPTLLALQLLLALFAGFFLYIGSTQLLAAASEKRFAFPTALVTVVGATLIYGVARLYE